jgi:hypothetical protein
MSRVTGRGLTLAALLALAPAARAQAPQPERPNGYTVVSESQFAALTPATAQPGARYNIIYAKFHKQFNEQLKLHAGQSLEGRLLVRDAALRTKLNADEDSSGARIPKFGNIQILGVGQVVGPRGGAQVYTLVVERVLSVESDLEYARRRIASFPARDAPGAAAARVEQARYIQARVARYYASEDADQEEKRQLLDLQKQLEDEVRAIELASLPPLPGGAETHIETARRYRALDVLATVWAHPEVPAELRARAERALTQELHAQRYMGRWYSYEEFKDLLGFTRVGDRWVTDHRAEFLLAVDDKRARLLKNESQVILPPAILERSKDVVEGMTKDMALGLLQTYPARVDRVRETQGQRTYVFEQWVMEEGLRIYFCNGIVFKKVEPAAPTPTAPGGSE